MKKNEREESLGSRLKGYERDFEKRINPTEFVIVRCDGHKFSRYTKGMRKPFDKVLSKSMEDTAKALITEFGPSTVYTQSDEITMVFPPMYKEKLEVVGYRDIEVSSVGMCDMDDIPEYRVFDKNNKYIGYIETIYEPDVEGYSITKYYVTDDGQTVDQCSLQGRSSNTIEKTEAMFAKYTVKKVNMINNQILGGRIQKMSSLIAGFTTMAFNKSFKKRLKKEFKQNGESIQDFIEYQYGMKAKVGNAWFDARVYGVPSKEEAYNSVMWRQRDAFKNAQSMFAQTYCSHKSLLNKTGPEQVAFCLEETGKDFSKVKKKYQYGILVKREQYQKDISDLDKVQTYSDATTVTRTRVVSFTDKRLTSFSEDSVDLVVRKLK